MWLAVMVRAPTCAGLPEPRESYLWLWADLARVFSVRCITCGACVQQLDQTAQFFIDLPEVKGRKLGRVCDALLRTLRLLLSDEGHEISLKKRVIARA